MKKKTFIISNNNETNLRNLKKITKIEKGKAVSEAKIINVALTQFFRNNPTPANPEYNKQIEVLECYNLI